VYHVLKRYGRACTITLVGLPAGNDPGEDFLLIPTD
jgi:hypothetical protein